MPEVDESFIPNSPAADIAMLLLEKGIVNNNPYDESLPLITVGFEPKESDGGWPARNLVSVYDIGGMPSNPAWQRDEPRILVRVKARALDGYPEAFRAQQIIKNTLLGMDRVELRGTLYVGVWQQVDIASISPDYNERPILVASYRMVREYYSPNRKCIK